jgi:DNA modification methylase
MPRLVQDLINKYHIWDARRISELLPDEEFVDVTITSPPYWNLKDYGADSQIGFGQTYEQYLNDLEEVFRAVYRVTSRKGSLWIISDTLKQNRELILLPFDLARRLKSVGWVLQDIIIWNKDRTLPWSHQGKLRNIFEYIAFYSKGPRFSYHLDRVREIDELREWWVRYPERYSPEGKAPTRAWSIPIPRQGSWGRNWVRHFNPLPPELVKRILLLTTGKGDTVLDPFCGSGAVLAQACVMGRNYIGLDLNPSYREMFGERVLPSIRALYEHNAEGAQEVESRKRAFGELIRSLRKVKYSKELVRLYRRSYGPVELEAVLALEGSRAGSLEVIFLFPTTSRVPADFLARADELSKRPPLSKYGIGVALAAYPVDIIARAWLEEKGLDLAQCIYVYARGRTYAWAETMSVKRWLELIESKKWSETLSQGYPPIISDICVKADPRSPFL